MDDVFMFGTGDPITCPECGSRCDHPDANAGVAECLGCTIAFNYEIEEDCPVCGSSNIKRDTDFPDTMTNCKDCGAEWNEDEVTLNPKEV